jgi:4-diphosphocytidyl-2-C-methyl-D-erythritol kinase
MISFPPCKINVGLNVVLKRSDGYHEIETCFYPLPWTDILEIIPADKLEFTQSGLSIPGKPEDNLCVKAYQLLRKDVDLPPVKIHLHKIIPTGAGLGGGSSDGAHALRLLNAVFNLQIATAQLKNYASQLGSDCAFFIEDKPMLGTGRGEILEDAHVSLKGKYMVLVKPEVHISTAEAYASIIPAFNANRVQDVVAKPIGEWKKLLQNDFETPVFRKHPLIGEIKEKLYQHGATYASMSGSGSSVYGIFENPIDLKKHFPDMVYWSGVLH